MVQAFAEELIRRLESVANEKAIQTGSAVCESWAEYHSRVGIVRGLREACRLVKEVAAKHHADEDNF